MRVISQEEAFLLCATGEWVTDEYVRDTIHQKSKHLLSTFDDWPDWKGKPVPEMVEMATEFFISSIDMLEKDCEALNVHHEVTEDGKEAGLRVKPYTVFKVKSTALDAGTSFFALLLAVFSTTPLSLLIVAWFLYSTWRLINKIKDGYEQLTDQDERLVFEALFRCQGRLCVRNYDALQKKNYDEAYGYISPALKEIEVELKGKTTRHSIQKTLASLKARKIVEEREGQWSIAF